MLERTVIPSLHIPFDDRSTQATANYHIYLLLDTTLLEGVARRLVFLFLKDSHIAD